jgi:Big-like domain-containing protein
MKMRVLAAAFTTILFACGPDLATDPTSDPTTDPGTDGTGASADALVAATYDTVLKVPKCATTGASCDTGTSLVLGRGTVGPEPHYSNTINNSCADGVSGTFHSDESVDRVTVTSVDGTNFANGKSVRVDVTVWAFSEFSDSLDLYYAANANSPTWVLIGTVQPPADGQQVLSMTYKLPVGALQAVRAAYRFSGSEAPCSIGSYDDRDDLVFSVGPPDTTPPTVTLTAPANGATLVGTVAFSATASDNVGVAKVQWLVDNVVKATDTTSPFSVNVDTTTIANGNHLITAKAFDAAGNSATSAVNSVVVNNPANLITNGGFEGSSSPWVLAGTVAWSNSGGAHGGTGLMQLAGVDSVSTANVYQQITIPSTAPANLTFWVNITTNEAGPTAYDFFYVEVLNTSGTVLGTLASLSNADDTTGNWVQKSYSMATWKGQTVRLRFRATTDVSLPTTFKIDDVVVR